MVILTFRADGVILPGNTIIPRLMLFSSRMPRSLSIERDKWNGMVEETSLYALAHGLDAYASFFGKEHENLVGRIRLRTGEEIQLGAAGSVR